MAKYIFVTGGVVSSLGKGIAAASIGVLLKERGLKVTMQKFDPYINVDPSFMSPLQHGEVFVTYDGAETDLDLGHYERFIDENLTKYSSVSSGRIYKAVIDKERRGHYGGATIQVIPHITDQIKKMLERAADSSGADVVIVEIGGTVGDIESLPFLEAIRQARRDLGYENTFYIHTTLIPYLKAAGEFKTKPTQHSVKELKSLGISPDMLILRSELPIGLEHVEKISLFTGMESEAIFLSNDVEVVYEIILDMAKNKVDELILNHFKINHLPTANLEKWHQLITKIKEIKAKVDIAVVGKYVQLQDAYLSVIESLNHAGYYHNLNVNVVLVDSENGINDSSLEILSKVDGIIVPGGFGHQGTEGKIKALKYGREHQVPTLGICFGMQLAAIEFARNVLNKTNACSAEFGGCDLPLIQENKNHQFKLGQYKTELKPKTLAHQIYGVSEVFERHRHGFEFSSNYRELFEEHGMIVSGENKELEAVDILELKDHPWFIAVQYHPEYISRPLRPHPLFVSFIEASKNKRLQK